MNLLCNHAETLMEVYIQSSRKEGFKFTEDLWIMSQTHSGKQTLFTSND